MPKENQRRTHSPQFKFKIALEALKGLRSINEIAAEHKVYPSQVTAWKMELQDGGCALFERKNARDSEKQELEARTGQLEQTLGKVVVEKEFLVKKCKQLGIEP